MIDSKPIRVLFIEDDEEDVLIVRRLLGSVPGRRFEVVHCCEAELALKHLREEKCVVSMLS